MLELKNSLQTESLNIEKALHNATKDTPLAIKQLIEHTLFSGGKRLRPFLTIIVARLLGYTKDDIYDLAISLEMLHTATLMHDDVIDNAQTRRNKKAAHIVFDVTSTILAGDALLAKANHIVAMHNDPKLSLCFSDATLQTALGEILEISSIRKLDQDKDAYLEIITGKTAWIIRAACEMACIKAKASPAHLSAAIDYGLNLGIAFQLVDDALDFAPSKLTGKPTGGDLLEGKLTPPILFYLNSLSAQERIDFEQSFTAGTFTKTDIEYISNKICAQKNDEQTREMAYGFLEKAINSLSQLPDGAEQIILKQVVSYVQTREK